MSIELKRTPTAEEVEQICTAAEEAARKHLLSRIPLRRVSDLDVTVEAVGDKPLLLSVDVGLELLSRDEHLQGLVGEATSAAFLAAEAKARKLDLCTDIHA